MDAAKRDEADDYAAEAVTHGGVKNDLSVIKTKR